MLPVKIPSWMPQLFIQDRTPLKPRMRRALATTCLSGSTIHTKMCPSYSPSSSRQRPCCAANEKDRLKAEALWRALKVGSELQVNLN